MCPAHICDVRKGTVLGVLRWSVWAGFFLFFFKPSFTHPYHQGVENIKIVLDVRLNPNKGTPTLQGVQFKSVFSAVP